MFQRNLYKLFIAIVIYLQMPVLQSCTKEYSYEGGLPVDTIPAPIHDTVPTPGNTFFPSCDACAPGNTSATLYWSFKYDAAFLCGSVTNSVITPERNGFTFFGPSTCSLDTGLIMTVFLDNDALKMDKANIITDHASLEYYDNTTMSDVFISTRHLISFTIDSYVHNTGMATGTFKGLVKRRDSTLAPITNGKFTIQFR